MGVGNGTFRTYSNGKVISSAEYVNGKKQGVCISSDIYGRKIKEDHYRNNQIDSSFTFYSNGKRSSARYYKRYGGIAGMEEYSTYSEYDSLGNCLITGSWHFEAKIDEWATFYPGGKKRSVYHFKGGVLSGPYRKWYANGKPMMEAEMLKGEISGEAKVWSAKGILLRKGTKEYQEIVEGNLPDETFVLISNGAQPDKYYNTDRTHVLDHDPDEIIDPVQEMAVFPGGNDSITPWINRHVRYPKEYLNAPKEGTVFVQFIVEVNGSVSNVEVLKGVPGAPLMDQEAIRVVQSMPKWKPGMEDGKSVRSKMRVAVRFRAESAGN
jgi:TonB family protein